MPTLLLSPSRSWWCTHPSVLFTGRDRSPHLYVRSEGLLALPIQLEAGSADIGAAPPGFRWLVSAGKRGGGCVGKTMSWGPPPDPLISDSIATFLCLSLSLLSSMWQLE